MAQIIRSGDVAADAATKGTIASALLMPFIVWGIKELAKFGLEFPPGYDLMAAGALGGLIVKGWIYLRMNAHIERDKI